MSEFDPTKQPISGTVDLAAQLPNGRSIRITTHVYFGESKESVDNRLDLLQETIERQRIRCEIPELEAKREQMIGGLKQLRQVLGDLKAKQDKGGKLNSSEKVAIDNHAKQIDRLQEEIDKGEIAIAEAKKKAGIE